MKAPHRSQIGTTLIEALVTFLVLSLGLLTVSRVERQLRLTGETARQRSEAVRLAQEDIERLRSFAQVEAFATGRSYSDVVSSAYRMDAASGYATNTAYQLERQVSPANVASARNVSVSVAWTDRGGEPQHIRLESVLAANDPALSGALRVPPAHSSVNGPMARSALIPLAARNLGTGQSAFRLPDGAAVIFHFDNDSGVIRERCERVDSASSAGTAADRACRRVTAYLVSGVVRFSPDIHSSPDRPVPLATVTLRLTDTGSAAAPECATTSVTNAVGERYLQYACVVYPSTAGQWSGETHLAPDGWTLGLTSSEYHACSYDSGAGSGNGAPDSQGARSRTADFGRLANYTDVPGSLANQNFQVLPGNLPCPG